MLSAKKTGVSFEKKFSFKLQKYYEHLQNKIVTIHILRYYSFKKKCRNPLRASCFCCDLTKMYIIQKGEKRKKYPTYHC